MDEGVKNMKKRTRKLENGVVRHLENIFSGVISATSP